MHQSLMYAMIATCPDIVYAVGVVSHHISSPRKACWVAIKHIFRYIKGRQRNYICYGQAALGLLGYCDADMAGDLDTQQSTSGYVISCWSISSCYRLQKIVTLSTSEVYSAIKASMEAICRRSWHVYCYSCFSI